MSSSHAADTAGATGAYIYSAGRTGAFIGIAPVGWRCGDAHDGRGLAGVLSREREDRSSLARDSSPGSLLRLRSRQHGTLGVAVLAAADLGADGHRARLGGALDERELRPFPGTETSLEPGRAALAGALAPRLLVPAESRKVNSRSTLALGLLVPSPGRGVEILAVPQSWPLWPRPPQAQALQIILASARARLSSEYTEATKA
jgi:hypothetical protein